MLEIILILVFVLASIFILASNKESSSSSSKESSSSSSKESSSSSSKESSSSSSKESSSSSSKESSSNNETSDISNTSNLEKLLKHDLFKMSNPVTVTITTLPNSNYYNTSTTSNDARYYASSPNNGRISRNSLNDVFRYNPAPGILPGGVSINHSTRGQPTDIRQVGFLSALSRTSKVLPLYGYQTYSGSNQWIYFTSEETGGQLIKIPIKFEQRNCLDDFCKEIYDGDIVEISSLPYITDSEEANSSSSSNMYKATIYKLSLYH